MTAAFAPPTDQHTPTHTQIDLVIVATSSPDDLFGDAPAVAAAIGAKNAAAFDLTAACSGFLFALVTGSQVREGCACRGFSGTLRPMAAVGIVLRFAPHVHALLTSLASPRLASPDVTPTCSFSLNPHPVPQLGHVQERACDRRRCALAVGGLVGP